MSAFLLTHELFLVPAVLGVHVAELFRLGGQLQARRRTVSVFHPESHPKTEDVLGVGPAPHNTEQIPMVLVS